jgi:hypothetical protein
MLYHPKVFLAQDNRSLPCGAVVGSGNLSESGLQTSVEGAVLIYDDALLRRMSQWFSGLWNDPDSAEDIDHSFVRGYRKRWRISARARIRHRRFQRRKQALGGQAEVLNAEDIEVLGDLCETIQLPIAILSIDQAGNNVRNLSRLLSVLHDYPNIHQKAVSELRLLGFIDYDQLNALGRRARRCSRVEALARVWCQWVKREAENELLLRNPNIASFRRSASFFWRLDKDVRDFFLANLEDLHERDVLKAIELLCSGSDAVRELKLEDYRALAPTLARPRALPLHLRNAIGAYHANKGSRTWTGNDREVLLRTWRAVK